jgi:DNA-binding CsgD family transcriptional regulator
MNDDDILRIQRDLRRRLFEGPGAIRWRPGRELAAQLLLFLDDPQACWRITAEWLRDTLDADRVDGGFGGFVGANGRPRDYVVMAEAQRDSLRLPPVIGLRFSASNPGLRAVWCSGDVAPFGDVSQEITFTEDLRVALREIGTAAKLALPVRDGARPIGLICADWHREAPRWNADACLELGGFAQTALGPVLATAAQLAVDRMESLRTTHSIADEDRGMAVGDAQRELQDTRGMPAGHSVVAFADLTPAEWKVARLVAMGLSYKEVAREVDRSLSTVDHQLRSIRDKLGVRSTRRLVRLLNDHLKQSLT